MRRPFCTLWVRPGDTAPAPSDQMQFSEFGLEDGTLDAIVAMGYEVATPIQEQSLPPLLAGRDIVGQARTGSGKTAAFGIPMVDKLRNERRDVQGLILVPTRELAIQVTEVLTDIARASPLDVISIYGGADFGAQEQALRRADAAIVVATPGRLLDHVQRGTIKLGHVRFLVLDEADRMLDMGFVHDMRRVLKLVPRERQTALFSATLPNDVLKLVGEFTHDAARVHVDGGDAVPEVEQFMARVEKGDKPAALLHLLHEERPERAVVFTRTKHLAKRLARRLDEHGWGAVALQGNMTQGQRERAMTMFRDGKARIMVATDVAARGLDIHGITHVVNFDLPDTDAYVHRVGRTARNGATGRAFTFVQSDEQHDFRGIERVAGKQITRVEPMLAGSAPRGPDAAVGTPQGPTPQRHGGARRSGGRHGQGGQRGQGDRSSRPQSARQSRGPRRY